MLLLPGSDHLTALGRRRTALSRIVSALQAAGRTGLVPVPPEAGGWWLDRARTIPYTDASLEVATGIQGISCYFGCHRQAPSGVNGPVPTRRVNILQQTDSVSTVRTATTVAGSYRLYIGSGSVTLSGTATGTYSAGTSTITCTAGTLTVTPSGTATNVDVRLSAWPRTYPVYQRVGDGSAGVCDYDTAGFPLWLNWSGGRRLQTISAWAPGGDAMRLAVVAMRSQDGTGGQILSESSVNSTTTAGTCYLFAHTAGYWQYHSRGTASRTAVAPIVAAPVLDAINASSDISDPIIKITINGALVGSSGDSHGAGAYTSQIIYDGHRSGGTLAYTGYMDAPAAWLPGDITAELAAEYLRERAARVGLTY